MSDPSRLGPTISIVTACYNSAPFIDRIYRSLATQTYRNFEWICVDDCSTDDTVERLVKLPSPGELGMQVYRLPQNTGGPVAWAVGTQRSIGEILFWLDHDDELFPSALEQIAANWPEVQRDPALSGLAFRALKPEDGSLIGRKIPSGLRFTASEAFNRFPDISDGTLALRGDLMRRFATVESLENVVLAFVFYNELTQGRPFLSVSTAVRYYHRDNPVSQTNLERISRKTVATYARIIDAADRFYLLRPMAWVRHIATMLRFSKQVHGNWFEGLRFVRRRSIRLLAILLWPLGWLAYRRRKAANVVEIPFFGPELASGLVDLRSGS